MLQNTAYMARVLKVIWPALHIEDYLPLPATASNSVSPSHDTGSVQSMHSTHSAHTTPYSNTNAGVPETIVPAAPTSSPVASPRDRKYSMDSTVTFESGDGDGDGDALSDEESDLIGPMPDDNINSMPFPTSTSTNVTNTTGNNNASTSTSYSVANRPIDGLRFLRELFAMSKFLQPEKRYVYRNNII